MITFIVGFVIGTFAGLIIASMMNIAHIDDRRREQDAERKE